MPYADYAFYTDTYGGSAVPAERWGGAALRADAVVDEVTLGRLWQCAVAEIPNEARMACCAAADVIDAQLQQAQQRMPGVVSEDVDGLRMAYESSAAQTARERQEVLAAVGCYLPRFHPLRYVGV